MSEVKKFLERTKHLIGEDEASLDDVQKALDALRKVSPELVDEKIYSRFKSLVDTKNMVEELKAKVDMFTLKVAGLEKAHGELTRKVEKYTSTLKAAGDSFNTMHDQVMVLTTSQKQRNDKINGVVEELDNYLRRHS